MLTYHFVKLFKFINAGSNKLTGKRSIINLSCVVDLYQLKNCRVSISDYMDKENSNPRLHRGLSEGGPQCLQFSKRLFTYPLRRRTSLMGSMIESMTPIVEIFRRAGVSKR